MTRVDIAKEMDSIIEQAYIVAKSREYGKNVVRVYFSGKIICIDVISKKMINYVIMINLSSEIFNIADDNENELIYGLLSIKALKNLFRIYDIIKGKDNNYYEAYDKSCIRHLCDNSLVSY